MNSEAWWLRADPICEEIEAATPRGWSVLWYAFADGTLEVASEDPAFQRRLGEIYGECSCGPPSENRITLRCTIRVCHSHPLILATFEDSQPLDQVAFNLSLFPDQRYEEIPGGSAPWRLLAHAGGASMPFAAAADNKVLLDRGQAWEAFVGHYALHRLLRMQSDMLFFHAASAGIGAAGVLIAGPEKSGKTTLSTTLASRGHAFLGDDLAGVRRSSGELVPLRRSASIRPGPRAPGMTELLERGQYREEVYADGETRVRARIGDLFPSAGAAPIPLHSVFFLRGGFGDRPSVKAFVAGPQHARWLTPLGSTLWGVPAGVRMMDFMRLLSRAHCYFLEPGGAPEETAQLVESTVKEKAWG